MGSPRRVFYGHEGQVSLVDKLREAMIEMGRHSAGEKFGSDLQKQCQRATVEVGNLVVMLTGNKDIPLQPSITQSSTGVVRFISTPKE